MSEELIQQQIERENFSKKLAVDKLHKNIRKDEANANAGSSIYGISLRNEFIGQMVETLEQDLAKLPTAIGRDVAQRYAIVEQCVGVKFERTKERGTEPYVAQLFDPALACHIALMLCLDAACTPKLSGKVSSTDSWKVHRPSRAELQERIADQLQRQLLYRLVEENFPKWFAKRKKDALTATGHSSPHYVFNRMDDSIAGFLAHLKVTGDELSASGLQMETWDYAQKQIVGSWLVQIAYSLGIFEWEKAANRNGKPDQFLVFNSAGQHLKQQYIQSAEMYAFDPLPMLIPPVDITQGRLGGWLADGACLNVGFNGEHKGELTLSQRHIDFYNHQQRQPFRVNKFVLALVRELKARNLQIGSWKFYDRDRDHSNLRVHQRLGIPDAVFNNASKEQQHQMLSADEEAFKAAKRARSKEIALQDQRVEHGLVSMRLLQIAEQCAEDERFFLPIQPDFRGRYYPRVSFLSYQSGDSGRSMLEFADGHTIDQRTKHHLSIHLANCAGEDKKSFDDRLHWVETNQQQIKAIARILEDWEPGWQALQEFKGEDPLQLAAACKEFYDLYIAKTRKVTHLPCSVDATCSGQQLIAGQLRSRKLAELVNVVPTTKPGDIYRRVMDRMLELSIESSLGNFSRATAKKLKAKIGRMISKTGFMSGQYGSGLKRQLIDIDELLNEIGLKLRPDEWSLFVGARVPKNEDWKFYAMQAKCQKASAWCQALEDVTKLKATFNWFGKVAETIHKSGATEMVIPLPTGSVFKQTYYEQQSQQIDTFHYGSSRCRTRVNVSTKKPVLKDWKKATAANQIHGLDASLLCFALESFPFAFFGCHDSVSTYAGAPMDCLQQNLRKAYVQVSEFNMWTAVLEANGLEPDVTEPPPIIGTLDPTEALNSPYLFC